MYLADLNSLVTINSLHMKNRGFLPHVDIFHASFTDFLMDPTRSKTFWINPQARHTALARWWLQVLRLKGKQDHSSE